MAVGNRIELKKVKLEPVSKMASAATALDRVHADMRGVVERYNARMIQKREQINAALGAFPIPPETRVSVARTQMSRSDYETRNEARPALESLMKEAGNLHHQVVSQHANYRDKRQVLLRQGIGTEERSRYEQTCARATAIGLANLAQHALAKNDLVLASAVAAEQASRPKNERLFSIQEFLRELDIPEFAAADEAYRVAEARLTSIAAQHREFLTGRPAGTQQIELALAKREENPALLEEAMMQPGGKEEE
jgi:hypothetical protein